MIWAYRKRSWASISVAVSLLAIGGCASSSTGLTPAKDIYHAPAGQAALMQAQGPSVMVVGDVRRNIIAWNQTLTLSQAIKIAQYQGPRPKRFTVLRDGQQPMRLDAAAFFQGQDIVLEVGDRVEIEH